MSFSSWLGWTVSAKCLATWPSLPTKNFSKFQPISLTSILDLRNFQTGCVFGPFTSILENMGNVTLPQREGRERQGQLCVDLDLGTTSARVFAFVFFTHPYFSVTKALISASVPGSSQPNWLQGKPSTVRPSNFSKSS